MFRKNTDHLQTEFFNSVETLPEKEKKRLETSWAQSFYTELFCRIDEAPFAKLYSETLSRPNTPVNILAGIEILKAGYGWSDEELYEAFLFNLQVRYALGLRKLGEGNFELRTLYNFRARVSVHMQETGENLFEKLFLKVTDEQLEAMKLSTGTQRMDSTLVGSNIRKYSRLQLLVEVIQRVWRMLEEGGEEQEYRDSFSPYVKGTSGQYCYRLKGDFSLHFSAIGELMHTLVEELEAKYKEHKSYRVLKRVFEEHFEVSENSTGGGDPKIEVKEGKSLSASSLQSPDDLEATFRSKKGEQSRGYVINLTETCDKENEIQLITNVQVAPNVMDDQRLMVDGIGDLKDRTGVETMWTDGGYTGPDAEKAMREQEVEHRTTAIRGGKPSSEDDQLKLEEFEWETDKEGKPVKVSCPGEQEVEVVAGRKDGRFMAEFDEELCAACPFSDRCPAKALKRRPVRVLRINTRAAQVAKMRQEQKQNRKEGNIRAAVEATVRSVIHPFGGHLCKLPVRGIIRNTQIITCSALMVNLRRIWKFTHAPPLKCVQMS